MIRWELLAVIGFGAVIGLAVAAATLVLFSRGIADTTVPYLPWQVVIGIVSGAFLLGLGASELPRERRFVATRCRSSEARIRDRCGRADGTPFGYRDGLPAAGPVRPAVHAVQCTSSTGSPSTSSLTQSTSLLPSTSTS
jgi:hypothetical protein